MASKLTALLRELPDEELVALLRQRPDLLVPVPSSLSALAARAQSRASVARAIDQLNQFQLEVLDGLRLTRELGGSASLEQLLAMAAAPTGRVDPAVVRAAVRRLRGLLLVHGSDENLSVPGAVDEVLGPYPAGLGRPAAELDPATAELVADAARLRRTLLSAPPAARAVLGRLATEGPVGAVSRDPAETGESEGDRGDDGEDARRAGSEPPLPDGEPPLPDGEPPHPVEWLVSRGLLVVTSPGVVELPREVGLLLRRDTGPLGALHPEPPAPAAAPRETTAVDNAGAGQVMEVVQYTGALLEACAAEPVPLLRTGGLGVRELRRLARTCGLTETVAALLVECASAAGLLGQAESGKGGRAGPPSEELRPSEAYDAWRTAPIAARWHTLAVTWLAMTRAPGLVGQRDSRDRVINALGPDVAQATAPALRRAALGVLAGLASGTAPSEEEVLALLAWHYPRRMAARDEPVRRLLAEAAELGITARGALTSHGAALLAEVAEPGPGEDPLGVQAEDADGELTKAAAILDALLPAPVDRLLVQADLTVVVPGPPEPTLAAELELITDPESAGGASVHRVTHASVRRALDAGYTAEDLHHLFARRSRTEVPQALTYLVDDVARVHGGLRAGSARAYLRSDDEALVTQVVADRRLASLELRRLAPTVVVSPAPTDRLLGALRDAGYAPVAEDGQGAALLVRPARRRAPARPGQVTRGAPPHLPGAGPPGAGPPGAAGPRVSTPRLLGIIEDLRRADAAAERASRAPDGLTGGGTGAAAAQAHAEAMAVLQQAVREQTAVWVGYVDARGTTTRKRLRPVSIGAGYLWAEDERGDTVYTFALHRITGAVLDA